MFGISNEPVFHLQHLWCESAPIFVNVSTEVSVVSAGRDPKEGRWSSSMEGREDVSTPQAMLILAKRQKPPVQSFI